MEIEFKSNVVTTTVTTAKRRVVELNHHQICHILRSYVEQAVNDQSDSTTIDIDFDVRHDSVMGCTVTFEDVNVTSATLNP